MTPRSTRTSPTDRSWRVRLALPREASRLSWWREQWRRNPRYALALRAAIAAAIAWAVAGVLPGPAADYPYYAPFGAVIATTFTLAGSVRESVQSVGAIVVGGLVGWAVDLMAIESGPLAVALVVVPSVVLAGWSRLGAMGGWVPTSALFTLIIGHGEATYIGAYAGLTLVGALIGIAVNAVFPPLPLAPAQSAVSIFRRTLANELDELADLLESEDGLPTHAEWQRQNRAAASERARMHAAVAEVGEAAHRNRRARRYGSSIEALEEEAGIMDRLSLIVSDVADLLLSDVASDTVDRSDALAGEVGERICESLRTIARALENTSPAGTASPTLDSEDEPMNSAHAAEAVEDARETAPRDDDQLLVDGILISLKRAVDSLAAIERED